MKSLLLPALMGTFLALTGCASQQGNYSASTYSTGLQQQQVETGTVVAVQPVRGLGGSTIGSIAGGIAGALLGNQIGAGTGRSLATAVGGLAGAAGGGYAEQQMTAQQVLQVTVRLQGGQTIGVVEHDYALRPGQRVQVIHDPGAGWNSRTTRVLPL